jgi:glycosyltransferase involved in cell wall biosynthesis
MSGEGKTEDRQYQPLPGAQVCARELLPPITQSYLLCVSVPVWIDENAKRWTDELWAKDLELHLHYLRDLTIVSPCLRRQPESNNVCLSEPPFDRVKFIDLPFPRTYWQSIRTFPRYAHCLWHGAKQSAIVHSGFGGWPVAAGWFLAPLGKFHQKFVITNVESSFWRSRGAKAPLRERMSARVMDRLTRHAVQIADLRLFTSSAYIDEFLAGRNERTYVIPATWINEEWILSDDQAASAWKTKNGPTRLLFAGRLIAIKGLSVLLTSIEQASTSGAELEITIIGDGPMRDECVRAARQDYGCVTLRYCSPVPYGDPFLGLLRGQDAVLLPSLSDEQPRLLFDAYSQAVPVIGSATGGIRELLEAERTGRLVPPGDAVALADAMKWASTARRELRAMGMTALSMARGHTHQAMHRKRHEILLRELAAGGKLQDAGKESTRPC